MCERSRAATRLAVHSLASLALSKRVGDARRQARRGQLEIDAGQGEALVISGRRSTA